MTLKQTWTGTTKTLTFALALGGAVVACSSDDTTSRPADGGTEDGSTGGTGGNTSGGTGGGGTGGNATGGTGGGGTGGADAGGGGTGGTGDGGQPDAGDGGPSGDASPEAATDAPSDPGPDAVLCPAGDAGAGAGTLFVAGTNYCASGCTTSEVAAVDVARGCVLGRATLGDSDTGIVASGGGVFAVERNVGALDVLSPAGAVLRQVDLHGADGGAAYLNPHDVVRVPGGKAYVSLFGAGAIAVVDPDAGSLVTTIDLSSLLDPSDTDGSVDVDSGFHDPTTGRVYFVLQRVDINSAFSHPSYTVACPPVPSVLVAVDPTTNALVDFGGGGDGAAPQLTVALGHVQPTDVKVDVAGRRAFVVSSGCRTDEADGGWARAHHGVEAVNLDTLAVTSLYAPTSRDYVSRLVLLGSNVGALQTFDELYTTLWNVWSASSPALGAALGGVPDGAVGEGDDTLLGLALAGGGRADRVVRYTVSTQTSTDVVTSPWTGSWPYVAGVAFSR